MPEPLNSLETQRAKILRQFLSLGDLRPGSISAVVHRCGKSYCHCAKPNDPGHAPQMRVLRKVHGKSVAETFPARRLSTKRRVRSPNSTAFSSWVPSS